MINGTIFQCFHWYSPEPQAAESAAVVRGVKTPGLEAHEAMTLWQQIAQDAPRLAQAGFSALWLPPMTKGRQGRADVGYNAYDLYDLGEFEQCGSVATKYGDRTQLLAAIASAKAANLQVYGDVVLHRKHGGDGIEQLEGTPVAWRDPSRALAPAQPILTHSQFTFPGRGQRYSEMTWCGKHFQRVNHNCMASDPLSPGPSLEPYSGPSKSLPQSSIGRGQIGTLYRLKFKTFSPEVDVRLGRQGQLCSNACVEGLSAQPDALQMTPQQQSRHEASLVCELDLDMPEVVAALEAWGTWFLDTTAVDGLRLDGTKHISASFIRDWLKTVKAQSNPSLFAMGDYWSDRVNDLHWYIAKSDGQLSLFDVPLHYNFHFASRQGRYYDLRNILKGTLMVEQPTLAVTFVENHNSQPLQLLESPVEAWFKPLAYALILLRYEGYPCVFAGDYYGAHYYTDEVAGNKPSVQRDIKLPAYQWLIDRLLFARSHCAYGKQYDYFETPNLIGWTRLGDAEHPQAMAVVMSNHHDQQQWMEVGKAHAQFTDITQHISEPVWTNECGWGHFGCRGSSVSVWVEIPRGSNGTS
ncbi:MAG: alpha-amylase [Cyanobacteria bacterium J06597_16]